MDCYQLFLPNFGQIETRDQAELVSGLGSLFSGPLGDARLITQALPANLDRLLTERRRLALQCNHERARRGLMEEVRLLEEMARGEFLKTRHFLLDFDGVLGVADLAHWLVRAESGYPQLPISGLYAEAIDHMYPVLRDRDGRLQIDNSRYRYGIISSYQLTRT